MTTPPPPLVLVVTGPDALVATLRRLLEPAGIEVRAAVEGAGADRSSVTVVVADAARASAPNPDVRPTDAELSAWAHRAHHDLLTPLAVISGMAETLEQSWERLAETDRTRLLSAIRNQSERATTLLDEAFATVRRLAGEAADEAPPAGG